MFVFDAGKKFRMKRFAIGTASKVRTRGSSFDPSDQSKVILWNFVNLIYHVDM